MRSGEEKTDLHCCEHAERELALPIVVRVAARKLKQQVMDSQSKETDLGRKKRRRRIPSEWAMRLDAALLGVLLAVTYLVAAKYQAFELLHNFSRDNEHWQLDEIIIAILVGFAGLMIFAIRRARDLRGEIDHRKQVEKALLRHQRHLQELVDDATAQLRMKAQETERALKKEQQLNELQRQFISLASHEFRTPLAIIDVTAQRINARADKLTPDQLCLRTREIRAAVDRMTQLMESTLATARLDAGELSIETAPCDIGSLIAEVCSSYQTIAGSHVISCDISNLPDLIEADANAVRQALTNLVSNAVKYSPGSKEIQVKARAEGAWVSIDVIDQGLGIPKQQLPHMFTRFFRASSSSGIAGTGLGLHLVKTLAEMHGGSASVESEEGKGSTFTLRLPVAGPQKTATAESKAA